VSQFAPEDSQGSIDLVSNGDITFEADRDQDGAGDLVFRTGGVERARIKHDGSGTGWPNVLGGSMPVDYVIVTAGSTVSAIPTTPGLAVYSGAATDAAAVIQQAVNALVAGTGGAIVFKQPLTFTSQLTLYPNIAFMGSGAHGYDNSGTLYGPVITTSYNGSAILCTGDSRNSTMMYLANFEIVGSHSHASQNGIEFNISGGNLFDVFMDNVFVDNMGQHGIVFGGNQIKLHANRLYVEICAGNGIDGSSSTGNNTLALVDPYIYGNTGWGLVGPTSASEWTITGGRFTSNTAGAISMPNTTVAANVNGVRFDLNGGSTAPQIVCASANFGSARNLIVGCTFSSTSVTNHISLAGTGFVALTIADCQFYGSTGDAIVWTTRASNRILIDNCMGYTDIRGKITNAFSTAPAIGAAGTVAAPSASTAYKVEGTKLMVAASGGTGVSITITDPGGNTIAAGLTTYTGLLPVGYAINFGAFSVAPTVVAAVA
jgi:hypothetical protein